MIKRRLIFAVMAMLAAVVLAGCDVAGPAGFNARIGQQQAMEIMAGDDYVIILDVRTLDEFNTGHIPDAVSLPVDEIEGAVVHMIPNRGEIILVYCRSGARSVEAATILADLGYYNVFDFGGIIDWTGEVVVPSH
jgi:rhodanese-related sulfurtransferase